MNHIGLMMWYVLFELLYIRSQRRIPQEGRLVIGLLLSQVYGVSVENIFEVQAKPSVAPTYDEIKKLPNKLLLWCGAYLSNWCSDFHKYVFPFNFVCYWSRLLKSVFFTGTRSSNLVRHLNKGFEPAVCQIPAPGYMVIQCSYIKFLYRNV